MTGQNGSGAGQLRLQKLRICPAIPNIFPTPSRPADYHFAVARYTAAGVLDTTFNSTGKRTVSLGTSTDYAYAEAIQSDGKIVVAGSSGSNMAVIRVTVSSAARGFARPESEKDAEKSLRGFARHLRATDLPPAHLPKTNK